MDSSTEQRLQSRRLFTEFLDSDEGRGGYVGRVREMMARKQTRLLVDVADLRLFNASLTRKCVAAGTHSAWRAGPGAGGPGGRRGSKWRGAGRPAV